MVEPTENNLLCDLLGIRHPIIGGAMYPCSNPELVAAVSAAGGIGVLQPVSLVYVFGLDLREGIRRIRSLTDRPIGMNVLTERSSDRYLERMQQWLDIALEEGIRFFVSSLGNPRWIVERVVPAGGLVFHDVTERRWADKAVAAGVHGLIAVNGRAGGHAGDRTPSALLEELGDIDLPIVCAGGIGDRRAYREALGLGYVGVQIGTRLIATTECSESDEYKRAIIEADEDDIVLTHRITGVPVSVIRTPRVAREGTEAGPFERWLLTHPRIKHRMRLLYSARSFIRLKRASRRGVVSHRDYLQAGKSVAGIRSVEPVAQIVRDWTAPEPTSI
ncbi:MAG: nitronate monooxygenase [Thermoanaerobaculales bacterium]|jgi:nitronate monooxygenase|nr:nitronate monooxygenase [Thermoanaerobaculales bacterium]